jgi:Zn-dependent protease with chaperone function
LGYILHILFALITLAAVDAGLTSATPWSFVVPLLAIPIVLAGPLIRRLLMRGHFRTAAALERALGLSPSLLHLLAVLLLGWCEAAEAWFGLEITLEGWPGMELLVGIAPYLLYQVLAIDARARLGASVDVQVGQLRSFQLRLFLSALVPVALLVAATSLLSWNRPLRVRFEEIGMLNAALSMGVFGALVLFLPGILRRTWETAPIEGCWQRTLLDEVARRAGFRCKALLRWRTANQMTNAAIVGFTPRSRLVLFSDALLAQLQPNELAAVFAHEIGHAKRRHAEIFALYAILLFLALDLGAHALAPLGDAWSLGVAGVAILAWLWSFGYLSRRFELEADLASVELLGDPRPLAAALEIVTGTRAAQRSSWRHFSTAARTRFVELAAADSGVGRRLRRVLGIWRSCILVGFALACFGELFVMLRSWDEDQVVVALRLGDYDAAHRRLAGGAELAEELVVLVERAAALPSNERTPVSLKARAYASLAEGDRLGAMEYLQLVRLRGEDADVEALLDAVRKTDEQGLRALLESGGEEDRGAPPSSGG